MPEEKSGGGWNFWGSFMYRKRVWVQALPWFQICARGRYAEGTGKKSWKGLYSGPFPTESRAGIFHFLEIVTGWLVPSTAEHPLAENRLKTGFFSHGSWKYKGKIQAVLYILLYWQLKKMGTICCFFLRVPKSNNPSFPFHYWGPLYTRDWDPLNFEILNSLLEEKASMVTSFLHTVGCKDKQMDEKLTWIPTWQGMHNVSLSTINLRRPWAQKMVIGCQKIYSSIFLKEKEWEGMLTSLHFFCFVGLPYQGKDICV
jgi:hypothetical protein